MLRVLNLRTWRRYLGTTLATEIFCGGQTPVIWWSGCLSIFLSRALCCSPTLPTPAGVPLLATTSCQAYGLRTSRIFPSTIASSWRFFMQSAGFSTFSAATRCPYSRTTPQRWLISTSKGVPVRLPSISWLSHPAPLRTSRCSSAPPNCPWEAKRLGGLPQSRFLSVGLGVDPLPGSLQGSVPPLAGQH